MVDYGLARQRLYEAPLPGGGLFLGDFARGDTIVLLWASNDRDGGAVARSVAGSVVVHKSADDTESSVGVTDTASFDGQAGLNLARIVTTNSWYTSGTNYHVLLKGATIDGESVSAVLGEFGIERMRS